MVEQSYAEEPRGECAEDSVITTRDRSEFAIFTSLEHADKFFGIHAASKNVHFLLCEATSVGIYKVLVGLAVGAL